MEHGGQCDGAIYCRIMFDDETSAEVPEHEEWLHSKCFPLLEREYGIKTQIVQGKYTYTDCFYKQYEKGGKVGKIWGFPFLRGAWCNTRLSFSCGEPLGGGREYHATARRRGFL